MMRLWIVGLLLRRPWQLAGFSAGIAATVGLLACLAVFLSSSAGSMTKRAIAAIPVDWQVEAVPSADVEAIKQAIGEATRVSALHEVRYADVAGFHASVGNTLQTTGAGKVIAFDDDYAKAFPKELRLRLAHDILPPNPMSASNIVNASGRNLEARVAGAAVLANNLGARLDAVREDALYARVLFLFLGVPGVFLAAAVTLAITAAGSHRRRTEHALLRMRGASARQILSFAFAEALLVAVAGILGGAALAGLLGSTFLGPPMFGRSDFLLFAAIAFAGLFLAMSAVIVPAWLSSRKDTVRMAQLSTGRWVAPPWQRLYLDLVLLAIAAIIMWQAAGSGYQVVLAPEGVAATITPRSSLRFSSG